MTQMLAGRPLSTDRGHGPVRLPRPREEPPAACFPSGAAVGFSDALYSRHITSQVSQLAAHYMLLNTCLELSNRLPFTSIPSL